MSMESRSTMGAMASKKASESSPVSARNVLDRPDLAIDPRYATNADRLANLEVLIPEIERALASDSVDGWVGRLLAEGVPCGPILDYAQVFAAPHTAARGMVEVVDHPVEGPVPTLGIPVKLGDTPGSVRRAPPVLGQHTESVLVALSSDRSPWGIE